MMVSEHVQNSSFWKEASIFKPKQKQALKRWHESVNAAAVADAKHVSDTFAEQYSLGGMERQPFWMRGAEKHQGCVLPFLMIGGVSEASDDGEPVTKDEVRRALDLQGRGARP